LHIRAGEKRHDFDREGDCASLIKDSKNSRKETPRIKRKLEQAAYRSKKREKEPGTPKSRWYILV